MLLDQLSNALAQLTGDAGTSSFDDADVRQAGAVLLWARSADGQPLGCGALRPHGAATAEIKRMFAAPGSRGIGTALLQALEVRATELGYQHLVLSTRVINARAVQFYRRHGYADVPPWGKYIDNPLSVCLGKALSRNPPASAQRSAR